MGIGLDCSCNPRQTCPKLCFLCPVLVFVKISFPHLSVHPYDIFMIFFSSGLPCQILCWYLGVLNEFNCNITFSKKILWSKLGCLSFLKCGRNTDAPLAAQHRQIRCLFNSKSYFYLLMKFSFYLIQLNLLVETPGWPHREKLLAQLLWLRRLTYRIYIPSILLLYFTLCSGPFMVSLM